MDALSDPNQQESAWQGSITFDPAGLQQGPPEFHPGGRCPNCGEGVLDYDGMLNLGCEVCGFSLVGCFT